MAWADLVPPPSAPLNDLDIGGYQHMVQRLSLGPSIGSIDVPQGTLRVTSSAVLQLGYGIVAVNATAPITLTLPAFKGVASAVTTQAVLAGRFAPTQITIYDSGGHAGTFPITINAAPGETISGLTSVTISGPFGAAILWPNVIDGGCSIVN
jgi:hypothetical protein